MTTDAHRVGEVRPTDVTLLGLVLGAAFARGDVDLRAVYDAHAPLVYAICRKALGDAIAPEK